MKCFIAPARLVGGEWVPLCAPLPVEFDWCKGDLRPSHEVMWTWEDEEAVQITHLLIYNDVGEVFARVLLTPVPPLVRQYDKLNLSNVVLNLAF